MLVFLLKTLKQISLRCTRCIWQKKEYFISTLNQNFKTNLASVHTVHLAKERVPHIYSKSTSLLLRSAYKRTSYMLLKQNSLRCTRFIWQKKEYLISTLYQLRLYSLSLRCNITLHILRSALSTSASVPPQCFNKSRFGAHGSSGKRKSIISTL